MSNVDRVEAAGVRLEDAHNERNQWWYWWKDAKDEGDEDEANEIWPLVLEAAENVDRAHQALQRALILEHYEEG